MYEQVPPSELSEQGTVLEILASEGQDVWKKFGVRPALLRLGRAQESPGDRGTGQAV